MISKSKPAKADQNNTTPASLPWWTWILPFFVANLGTWLSLWFKTDPGASLWYLPMAFGIVMAYWWGPRVLLGIYLNAVVCAPLWDLPWRWSLLYALPETIEVGLSWLLFIKVMQGKCWLPNLRNVATFLLFGSFAPTFLANIYLVMQLYFLGDIPQNAVWDNWRVVFSADLATQLVLAVPLLVLFTKPMREKGWTQTRDTITQLPLLPDKRNSLRDIFFIITILGTALIAILTFSIHEPWILYGFLMILIAIRYGVNMAVIGTSWIGILAFLLPVILTGKLGFSTATYGDFVSTNFDILFLCGVTLLTGRAISDLFMEISERKRAEEQVSLLQIITLEVAAASDLSSALQVVLRRVCEKTGWVYGQAWVPRQDASALDCNAAWFSDAGLEKFRVISMGLSFLPGQGLPGRVLLSKQPVWLEDATLDSNFPRAASAVESGLKAALAVPILADSEIVAVIEFFLREERTEDAQLVKVIAAVAAQLGLVLERKRVEGELAIRAEQMRALAGHLESVREDERTRIAREIHDEFGQFLTAIKMDLAWISRRLPAGDEKRERLNQASALVDENVRLVQRIATDLRPGLLDDLGLMTALDWQAQEFSKHTGLPCNLQLPESDLQLNAALNTALFRVFQETLTNIARHAQASRVEVSLQERDQALLLTIHDNGRGITDAQLNDRHSLGLLGLHERVAQWGGQLSIRGEPGKGTTVTVQIPIPTAETGVSS